MAKSIAILPSVDEIVRNKKRGAVGYLHCTMQIGQTGPVGQECISKDQIAGMLAVESLGHRRPVHEIGAGIGSRRGAGAKRIDIKSDRVHVNLVVDKRNVMKRARAPWVCY